MSVSLCRIMKEFKFADYNALGLKPKHNVRRFDDKLGNRFYYFWDDNGQLVIASGITSWLKSVKPESKYMTDWKIELVKQGLDWSKVLNTYADYGTAMHAVYADIMIEGKPRLENLDVAKQVCVDNKKNPDMIIKDTMSFIKWMRDYNVKPLLIEAILPCIANNGEYYAMTVDLLCEMDYITKESKMVQNGFYVRGNKKGQPKFEKVTTEQKVRIIANVDFKSNFGEKDRKSFFDDHKFQLIAASKSIEQNFSIETSAIFNFSPNNWTKEPTYTFYEHTTSKEDIVEFELLEKLASVRGAFEPKGKFVVYPELSTDMDLSKPYEIYNYREYVEKMTSTLN